MMAVAAAPMSSSSNSSNHHHHDHHSHHHQQQQQSPATAQSQGTASSASAAAAAAAPQSSSSSCSSPPNTTSCSSPIRKTIANNNNNNTSFSSDLTCSDLSSPEMASSRANNHHNSNSSNSNHNNNNGHHHSLNSHNGSSSSSPHQFHHHHHHLHGPITPPSSVTGGGGDPHCCAVSVHLSGVGLGKWSARISLCVGCGSEIYDQYILRVHPDLEWHAACLKCADCHQYLDESCTCFVREGKTYCKRDYLKLFGVKCAKCHLSFSKTDLVMRVRGNTYHVDCFCCVVCARQLTRGEEFSLRGDDLFCKADHESFDTKLHLHSNSNSSANSTTSSTSSLTPLTPVTPDCLKENGGLMGGLGVTTNSHHSSPLTVLGPNGALPLPPPPSSSSGVPSMPLHPAGIIPGPGGDLNGHMNSSNISPSGGAGAPTHLSSQLSGLHLDHHTSLAGAQGLPPQLPPPPPPPHSGQSPLPNGGPGGGGGGGRDGREGNGGNNGHHGREGSHKGPGGHHRSHRSLSGSSRNADHKPTRVRTVLNEKQLQTLRNCYNANPRPDALMKEQLVEITGLSPRVIRVWFQNKRCKDKKRSILIKQMQQQEKDGRQLNIGQMRGVPMITSSPVRHDSPDQMMPMDVHSYQPPWKALADYAAMHQQSELDPNAPQFQHLVSQMHGYDGVGGLGTPGNETSLSSLGHGGPPTGPCTPMSYLDAELHHTHSNLSSDLSSPCTSE